MATYSDFVLDDYKRPILGARVEAYASDGTTLLDATVTDALGAFTVTADDQQAILLVEYGGWSERSVVIIGNPPEYVGPAGPQGPQGPGTIAAQSAAVAADWGALPNIRRKIAAAQYHNTDSPPVVVKLAGIGSSNMANTNGTLAGNGNSPIEMFLKALKEELDPAGVCQWDFQNFGVNGSGVLNYSVVPVAGETLPQTRVIAYDPDLVLICYGTNDASATGYNGSTTRPGYSVYLQLILDDLNNRGIDAVVMTVPHAHVERTSTPDANGFSGLKVSPSVGVAYPRPSFAVGQQGGAAANKSFTFNAANSTITAAEAGLFKNASYGFGIAPGRKIFIALPDFSSDPQNGGYYSISAVNTAGTTITLDHKYDLANVSTGPFINERAPGLTNATYNAIIQRIDIDATTELRPTIAESVQYLDIYGDGRTAPALTRFLDINDDTRRLVASYDRAASLVDVEAYWLPALIDNGEDVYFSPLEVVHWNSVTAQTILYPAFKAWAKSLGRVKRALSAHEPTYSRSLIVRPDAQASADPATLRADSLVDIQIPQGGAYYLRGSDTLQNAVLTNKGVEIARSYPIRGSINSQAPGADGQPGGRGARISRRTFEGWAANINIFPLSYIDLVVPNRHFVRAQIEAVHPFRGQQMISCAGSTAIVDSSSQLALTVTQESLARTQAVSPPANVITVAASGQAIRITPDVIDGTTIHWRVTIISMDYFYEGTPAEDAILYGFEPTLT